MNKKVKVSDRIAAFLEEKGIRHVFGIIGAGNVHIFDSIQQRGYTQIICVHHEQAATMAMQSYYRVSGTVTAALLTTGGGSTNGVTGVLSAWADSIPGLIISGNEHSKYNTIHEDLRMWGVQGYDSSAMVEKVTKFNDRVLVPERIEEQLGKAYAVTTEGRPGPVWIDIPMNIQSSMVGEQDLVKYNGERLAEDRLLHDEALDKKVKEVVDALKLARRPLFWFGNGIRLSGGEELLEGLVDDLQVPSIVSWAGIDMIDSNHPLVFGRAGTYGQRSANFILQNCDLLICIGTRLAISQIGYDINELARDAKIAVVDVDPHEIAKYRERFRYQVNADAKEFITSLVKLSGAVKDIPSFQQWIDECNVYRSEYPWVTAEDHPDVDGFINSYPFMDKLNDHLKDDQIVTTDMGTALLSGHQVLRLRKGQRLMTSTGLGEMGYGLPAAIGASFARNKGEVLCLNCDGGMMMNLQELQTIVHHQLPIKIFIFNNDGYLMIKHTQNALFNGRHAAVDERSGVSCPDFGVLAKAFNLPAFAIRTWQDFEEVIPAVQAHDGPLICEVFMHPQQLFAPKLSLAIQSDGTLVSPPLEDLTPLVSKEALIKAMRNGVHVKSMSIRSEV